MSHTDGLISITDEPKGEVLILKVRGRLDAVASPDDKESFSITSIKGKQSFYSILLLLII